VPSLTKIVASFLWVLCLFTRLIALPPTIRHTLHNAPCNALRP
jgi:hypothetical protein